MLEQVLNETNLNFRERSEKIADILRLEPHVLRSIYERLRLRFQLEIQRTSAFDTLTIAEYTHALGTYRGILPLEESLLGRPAVIRHSVKSNKGNQPTINEDTIVEYAAFNLFDSFGFNTPGYLVKLVHPSFREEFNLQMPGNSRYLVSSLPPLSMYNIVSASQLLPDLSEGGKLSVEEIGSSSRWFRDDYYTKAITNYFDEVERELSKFGVTLMVNGSNPKNKYEVYASFAFACVSQDGKVERVVFGDMQRFYDIITRLNSPTAIRSLPHTIGYGSGPFAPKVNLEHKLLMS